jgi:D-methionine transport system ATP-binding protein
LQSKNPFAARRFGTPFFVQGDIMIRLRGITKQYPTADAPVEALKQIDLHVAKGDIFAVVGMSGAGKSTLLRILTGLERPDAGEIVLFGQDLTNADQNAWRAARRRIGVVFQGMNLLRQKTVFENVAFPLKSIRAEEATMRRKVADLLAMVGLEDKAKRYPSELSGGQQQRVAIARALATDPQVLFLDEPTSALDALTTRDMIDLILSIQEQTGLTVVLISHDLHVVRRLATKVLVLEDGRVAECGSKDVVFSTPRSAYGAALLGKG